MSDNTTTAFGVILFLIVFLNFYTINGTSRKIGAVYSALYLLSGYLVISTGASYNVSVAVVLISIGIVWALFAIVKGTSLLEKVKVLLRLK